MTGEARGVPQRPAWSELRAELAGVGFRPSKRFGQNFLVDDAMVRAIARDARVEPGEPVLEIGAGLGFLTLALVALGARVTAVEIDTRLAAIARRVVGETAQVSWIVADALDGKHALSAELERALPAAGSWHLVANLPYSIGAPLVALLARRARPPASMTVLLQNELADRLAARPGSAEWGALSVHVQLRYAASLGRRVPPELFWPRPMVQSRVVRLELEDARPDASRAAGIDELVDVLFGQRRKALRAVLSRALGEPSAARSACEQAGLDPLVRAEDLDLSELDRLAATAAWRSRARAESR